MTVPLTHLSFLKALEEIEFALAGADQTKILSPGLQGPSDGIVGVAMSCLRSAACLAS